MTGLVTACPTCGMVHEDLANAENEVRRLRRESARLKTELQRQRQDRPEAAKARELFDYWVRKLNKDPKRTKYTEDRQKILLTQLKTYSSEELCKAFDGLALKPYAGPRGRSAEEYPGSKFHADIEHAISTAKRIESCWAYVDEQGDEKAQRRGEAMASMRDRYGADTVTQEPRWHGSFRDQGTFNPGGLHSLLEALAQANCDVRGSGAKYMAQCPAHEDRDPSLSILEKPDGRVLLYCFAGCKSLDVLHAVGLEFADIGGACALSGARADQLGMGRTA